VAREPRPEPSGDALRASADVGAVGAEYLRDRVERLAVEQHGEYRQVIVVEPATADSKTSRGMGAMASSPLATRRTAVRRVAAGAALSTTPSACTTRAVSVSAGPAYAE
jgi:hypothetical protein